MSKKIMLTMLNVMAGGTLEKQLDKYESLNLKITDLKSGIFEKSVEALSEEEAERAYKMVTDRGMSVYTMSTSIFYDDIEMGEDAFRNKYIPKLDNAIKVARILKPKQVRILMAASSKRLEIEDSFKYINENHSWLYEVYRGAIYKITKAGFQAVLENEIENCLFSNSSEITSFLKKIDRNTSLKFIWDIQNLWQMGTFPSLDVYNELKPYIGMVHLKGGKAEVKGGPLVWKALLRDASWPLKEIVGQIIKDGVSPVICLNPSHGETPEAYVGDPADEVQYLRETFKEIE